MVSSKTAPMFRALDVGSTVDLRSRSVSHLMLYKYGKCTLQLKQENLVTSLNAHSLFHRRRLSVVFACSRLYQGPGYGGFRFSNKIIINRGTIMEKTQ